MAFTLKKWVTGMLESTRLNDTNTNWTDIESAIDTLQTNAGLIMHALATHGHDIADVSNLQTALNGKAASSHTHTIANVTNLQTTLNGKAPSVLYGSTVPASLLPGQIFVKI